MRDRMGLRGVFGVLAVVGVGAACRPEPPSVVVEPTANESESGDAESTTAEDPPKSAAPHPPDVEALKTAAQAAAAAAEVTPGKTGPGPAVAARQPGRIRVANRSAAWAMPGPPQLVDYVRTYVTRAPWAEITPEGELVLRWWTEDKTPPASLYVGMRVEEDPHADPRYRDHVTEVQAKPGHRHEIRFPLAKLLKSRVDVNGIKAREYGEVAWMLEGYDERRASTVVLEGRTAFRLEGQGVVQLPTVVLGPLVHQVTTDSMIVSFETDVPTAAAVTVGDRLPVVDRTSSKRHEIEIQGLEAGCDYLYQVGVSNGVETSVTPVRRVSSRHEDGPVTVAIMSDSRSGAGPGLTSYTGINAAVLRPLVRDAFRRGAEAVLFPGDLIDGYSTHPDEFDWQLRNWLHVVEPIHGTIPFYTTVGNHEASIDAWSGKDLVSIDRDGEMSAEARFAALMVNPKGAPPPEREGAPPYDETVYSFDLGGVHFVMLNTNYWSTHGFGHELLQGRGNREGYVMDGQLKWLEDDLTRANEAKAEHIVVMGHEPAFPAGGHTKDGMWWKGKIERVNAMRERFWKILAKHGVVAYVSGDEHNYSRSLIGPETVKGAEGSVYSIISGGCGAPYYALQPPEAYADRVQTFSAQQNYTLWTFERGRPPRLRVYGITGALIEDVYLRTDGDR
jgi:hypothetical protein